MEKFNIIRRNPYSGFEEVVEKDLEYREAVYVMRNLNMLIRKNQDEDVIDGINYYEYEIRNTKRS